MVGFYRRNTSELCFGLISVLGLDVPANQGIRRHFFERNETGQFPAWLAEWIAGWLAFGNNLI